MQAVETKMRDEARACRERLRRPANAVVDLGIDLRRHLAPPPPEPPPEPPLEPDRLLAILLNTPPPFFTPRRKLQCVVLVVARFYNLHPDEIYGSGRKTRVALPRHVVCYFARKFLHYTYQFIGVSLNYGEHSTALFATRKVEARLADDGVFAEEIKQIWQALKAKGIWDDEASPQNPGDWG